MPRFFIAASNIFGGIAYLNGKDAEHIKVLRIRQGEEITICDGNGTDYKCRMKGQGSDGVEVEILETAPSEGEPTTFCSVYAAFSKGDKMESVIQKSVEIGAGEIVVFPSDRCVSKPDGLSVIKKLNRWQKISEEAAKQCGRGRIPKVTASPSYKAAIDAACKAQLPLFFYEDEKHLGLKEVLDKSPNPDTVSIVTGPEGGFEAIEVKYAADCGMYVVTMGKRILRCETAPLCALSAVMLHTGNL